MSASRLRSFTFVSQLVAVSIWAAVSASALQSFTCAAQHWTPLSASCLQLQLLCPAILYICLPAWAVCRLQSFSFVSLCLHLSPSSGLLCPPLPCDPSFVSQLSAVLAILYMYLPVSACVSQLWTAVSSALQSLVSQPWTSQTLVAVFRF